MNKLEISKVLIILKHTIIFQLTPNPYRTKIFLQIQDMALIIPFNKMDNHTIY